MPVFGLHVASEFPLPGLVPDQGRPDVTLTLEAPWWDPADAEVLSDLRFEDGRPALRVEAGPANTWRFWGHGYGEAIAVDLGSRVACAPDDAAAFPRLLYGQVLPFLSGRRGFVVLHAAALVLPEGGAVLVCGPSGTGKSTLLRALLERGVGFLADDAVAVDDALDACAGPGVIGPELEPASVAEPSAPVRAVVVLSRGGDRVAVGPAEPLALLGLGYDALPSPPERQAAALDRLSSLGRAAELLTLTVPDGAAGAGADELLAALAG